MEIRTAQLNDLDIIMDVFSKARGIMRDNGNFNQWINGYPSRELLTDDINSGNLYVITDEGIVHAAFAFITGEDPTYTYIEDGSWLSSRPYGAIHRIGSDGKLHGILKMTVDFCSSRINSLRIDTHADNSIMQAAVTKCGFKKCGIIYIEDGSPRIAYQQDF